MHAQDQAHAAVESAKTNMRLAQEQEAGARYETATAREKIQALIDYCNGLLDQSRILNRKIMLLSEEQEVTSRKY